MPAPTVTPETAATTFEPTTVLRHHRLGRALASPEALEEFLVNPEDVAKRFGVDLTETEMMAIRSASHFAAEWDLYCGEGRWLDAVLANGARSPIGSTAPAMDIVANAVRQRIARDILQDIPEAIRRTTDQVGVDTLLDGGRTPDEYPPEMQPLVRTLRGLVRNLVRELNHELATLTLQGAMTRYAPSPVPLQPQVPQPQSPAPIPTEPPAHILSTIGAYLNEIVHHAVQEAVERVRPGVPRTANGYARGRTDASGSPPPARR
jgi:hypothetical protein